MRLFGKSLKFFYPQDAAHECLSLTAFKLRGFKKCHITTNPFFIFIVTCTNHFALT